MKGVRLGRLAARRPVGRARILAAAIPLPPRGSAGGGHRHELLLDGDRLSHCAPPLLGLLSSGAPRWPGSAARRTEERARLVETTARRPAARSAGPYGCGSFSSPPRATLEASRASARYRVRPRREDDRIVTTSWLRTTSRRGGETATPGHPLFLLESPAGSRCVRATAAASTASSAISSLPARRCRRAVVDFCSAETTIAQDSTFVVARARETRAWRRGSPDRRDLDGVVFLILAVGGVADLFASCGLLDEALLELLHAIFSPESP